MEQQLFEMSAERVPVGHGTTEPERRIFMHAWCGTIVATIYRPEWASGGPLPAGKAVGRCPNQNCEKPDQDWWEQQDRARPFLPKAGEVWKK